MKTMYIGSGDVSALLAGKKTKTHTNLLRRFVSDEKPIYNAYASPIDACRAGQILEDRFALYLGNDWYSQSVVTCEDMDVFKASLDFARYKDGKIVDFKEMKTKSFADFIKFESMSDDEILKYVETKDKKYYNQIQEQLMCTGLESATLVYVAVYTYEDEVNYNRIIKPNEVKEITIHRDDSVIKKIREAGSIFQKIKDCYK